jgi:hypothetical protein
LIVLLQSSRKEFEQVPPPKCPECGKRLMIDGKKGVCPDGHGVFSIENEKGK